MSRPLARRAVLAGGAAALAALPGIASAHSLYGQWLVYRQKHLLIACHRADPAAYPLAKRLEAVLTEHLPQARTRIARAPFPGRVASLLATDQMKFALVSSQEVAGMAAASGDFAPYGKVETQLVAAMDEHLLVCRADVPPHHGWLIRAALVEAALPSPSEAALVQQRHSGVAAFDAGLALDMLPGGTL